MSEGFRLVTRRLQSIALINGVDFHMGDKIPLEIDQERASGNPAIGRQLRFATGNG